MTWKTGTTDPTASAGTGAPLKASSYYDVEVVGVGDPEYSRGAKTSGAPVTMLTLEVCEGPSTGQRLRFCRITWHAACAGLTDAATRSLGIPDGADIDPENGDAMRALLLGRRGRIVTADELRSEQWAQFGRFVRRSADGVYERQEQSQPPPPLISDDEIPF